MQGQPEDLTAISALSFQHKYINMSIVKSISRRFTIDRTYGLNYAEVGRSSCVTASEILEEIVALDFTAKPPTPYYYTYTLYTYTSTT
jgi:hypothetical protein